MTMQTSGFACSIHSFDFSNPEKTRFQYGSSVCLLSIAAPIAGTCEEASPAMIFAMLLPLLGGSGFGLRRGFLRRLAALARFRPVAFHRASARQHHRRIVVLGGAGHHGGE